MTWLYILAYLIVGVLWAGGAVWVCRDDGKTDEETLGCLIWFCVLFWPPLFISGLVIFLAKRIGGWKRD